MTRFFLTLLLVFGLSVPAFAKDASLEQRFITALQAGGFTVRELGYTFWGRLRIIAVLDGMEREIIINPNTGEVLRDQTRMLEVASSDDRSDRTSVGGVAGDDTVILRDGDDAVGITGALGDDVEVPLLTSPEVIEGANDS